MPIISNITQEGAERPLLMLKYLIKECILLSIAGTFTQVMIAKY